MSVIANIAEAVKVDLNSAPEGRFSQTFDATRMYVPIYELPDMKTLRVTVVPKALGVTPTSRSESQHDYEIDVAVQKKLVNADAAEIDPLMTLVEEIADFFSARRPSTFRTAMCVGVVNEPIYSAEHIEQLRQFTSLLTLTFRVMR